MAAGASGGSAAEAVGHDDSLITGGGLACTMVAWTDFLVYDFPQTTLYALWFLLGSQAVSGLSDLRRMSAQREFMEVWILFAIAVLGLDAWRVSQEGASLEIAVVKWLLVAAVGILSWRRVGVLFRLARGDVWAIVAVVALFNPLFVLLYVVILKVSDMVLRFPLRRFGSGGAYPFIPVVLVATLVTVALIVLDVVGRLLALTGAV